jgi:hypothetical protein
VREQAVVFELLRERGAVRRRGNDDDAIAAAQAGADVFGDGLGQEQLVLIDLDEMIAGPGVLQQLGPVGDGLGFDRGSLLGGQRFYERVRRL